LLPGGNQSRARRLPDKSTIHLAAGDLLRMSTPGGGGWGSPPGPVTGLTVFGEADGATVRIVDYDPSWPERFEVERARIANALGRDAGRIEHVGSTSVPGLAAKPVVDIMVTVDDPNDDAVFVPPLTSAGYVLRVIEPEHRMFRSPARDVHVHMCRAGGEDEHRLLLFRNWLRHDAGDRARYESVKLELASHTWESSGDYAEAKTDVVAEIMRHAEQWTRPD
jgi:GrpB-like predicted nucleotidyltransferase (UPF0157 family)